MRQVFLTVLFALVALSLLACSSPTVHRVQLASSDAAASASGDFDAGSGLLNTSTSSATASDGGIASGDPSAAPVDAGQDAGLLEGLLTCSPNELKGLLNCIGNTCATDAGPDLGCAFSMCGSFGKSLATPGCVACVMAGISMDTNALAQSCVKPGALGDASVDLSSLPF